MSVREVAPVETLRPGDGIYLPRSGGRIVAELNTYEDGTIVVTYFAAEEVSYENRARDKSGANVRRRLVLKSLRPYRPGEPIETTRRAGDARQLRAELEQNERERFAQLEQRIAAMQRRLEERRP